MQTKAALLQLRGDWAEFCERFGFPTWASGLRPCLACVAFGDDLHKTTGITSERLCWVLNDANDYDTAARRCECWVTLEAADHRELVPFCEV